MLENKIMTNKTCGKLYIAGEYSILTAGQSAIIKNVNIFMESRISFSNMDEYMIFSDMFDYKLTLEKDTFNNENILQNFDKSNKLICAICAAPMVLESAGVLKDRFVCYPGFEENVRSDKRGYVSDKNVLKDQNIITGKGPAFSMEFALFIVKNLLGEEAYLKVKNDLLYK